MNKAAWVIAHGSSKEEWITQVDKAVANVQSPLPIITSFLNNSFDRSIEEGSRRLKSLQIDEVIIIPLFVTSASTHIQELSRILSNYLDKSTFSLTSCINDHQLVVEHIIKQANKLSTAPKEESLLIIGHGSDQESYTEEWERILTSLTDKLKRMTEFAKINYATYLPNTIPQQLLSSQKDLQTIAVPLFLSKGVFTEEKIPQLLSGYPVRYSNSSYMSENWISTWLQERINESICCSKNFTVKT